jgi:hypothetical protein
MATTSKSKKSTSKKNPSAVALGRLGGLKGGRARAVSMTPEERSESARKAVQARWEKAKQEAENPQK